jgi:hypothetical protein
MPSAVPAGDCSSWVRPVRGGSPVVNVGELRKRIAHGNRRRKLEDSTADRLRPSWEKQLTADETKAFGALRVVQPKPAKPANVAGITT